LPLQCFTMCAETVFDVVFDRFFDLVLGIKNS
jgi:hypothetical protein